MKGSEIGLKKTSSTTNLNPKQKYPHFSEINKA